MSKITLTCDTCNKEFEKERNEYNRRIRLGKDKFYCGLSCSSKNPDNIKNITDNRSCFPVWELANPKKHDEYSMFRPTLKSIKSRVKEKQKEFNLTLKHLKDVWDSQKGKCPFTGFDLELRTYASRCNFRDKELSIKSASLDRIDNSKGYVIGNVRWVSVMFNFARNKLSDEDVIEFAQAVTRTTGAK
jgi:hypothetical protein